MAIKIKLMADYGCDPLWWADADKVGNIDPARLPLSQETINHLRKWATDYNATLNWQDPGNSPDLSPEEEAAFEQEGISLWKQLQKELAPNYEVVYFSESLGKVVSDINELKSLRSLHLSSKRLRLELL
ncbi:MAG: hypothetical protein HCA25_01500 [Dolichospermum sp. DET50]|nr:hypothetical protein [Dolichospermum sp. DET66]MBS3030987.1 hypothetical protein [Dolichospermum sp. DET67]MBS3036197.1 hypothetical protein [Dolichospermum sp. DET50]QSX68266.1 MAG: hypothetical protein EZY12_00670 [Dolichospermum sp. DET69]